jgi:hypothetical protein
VEDAVREVLDRVIRGIQSEDLVDPLLLLPYVRTHLTTRIRETQEKQLTTMPSGDALTLRPGAGERRGIVQGILCGLSRRERESLSRFYFQRYDDERILRELGMPPAESRSLRAMVRTRFRELCQQSAFGTG